MDKIRAEFEAKIKRPPGVFWNTVVEEYDGTQPYYSELAESYQGQWDSWQAAHALYTTTETQGKHE